ncbi:hypothetical protein Ahy_A05g023162 [Arachis hypogaea]|uniref:Protein FAR1-RELATED SEQUENCE n=1 Tax=Arachis hypogaea TaxID=3818 RepID=A0A445D2I6_ARAHY|nr:hypothetical protein Ahy_A05g023162 [Arachis hypogaea]
MAESNNTHPGQNRPPRRRSITPRNLDLNLGSSQDEDEHNHEEEHMEQQNLGAAGEGAHFFTPHAGGTAGIHTHVTIPAHVYNYMIDNQTKMQALITKMMARDQTRDHEAELQELEGKREVVESKMKEYHRRLALAYDKHIRPRVFLEGDLKTKNLDGGGDSSDDTALCKKCPSKDDEEHLSPTLSGVLSPYMSLQIQIMDDSTLDYQLNQDEVDFEFESNEVPKPLCVDDDQFVPKVGMTFNTLKDAAKFYKDYAKDACFSTRVRSTNRKENEIKNQSITCSREEKWKSKISPTEKTNPIAGLNCLARILYTHIEGCWCLDHFEGRAASFTPLLSNSSRDAQTSQETKHSIKLAFWADARSRAAFEYFGGVISIDTTYNTNRYNLVCDYFVGVNHHENAPKGFLTDQCVSMKRAIEAYMPTTIQCWCIWHITKKIPRKLNRYKGHVEIEQEMSQVIWNSHSKDSFDRNWNDFLLKYDLADNKWLSRMRSTQRSKSMHSFFNKFITRNSSLIEFVKQYDNCLGSREQAERESDTADFHTVIPCATKSSIEAQFQHVYTHQKFRKVKAQFREKVNCITRLMNSTLGYSVYEVGEQVSSSIFNKFAVTYDSIAAEVKYQCLLFESRGILCRHALSILSFERSSHDEPLLVPKSKRFDNLVFHSQNICEFATKLEELTTILHRAYDNLMVEMEELKAKKKGTCLLSHEDANLESINELQSSPRIRTRGRPKNRLGSKLDKQIANASKKKKTKALNELNLFDVASVVRPNSSQYQGRIMNYQFRKPTAEDSFLGV